MRVMDQYIGLMKKEEVILFIMELRLNLVCLKLGIIHIGFHPSKMENVIHITE